MEIHDDEDGVVMVVLAITRGLLRDVVSPPPSSAWGIRLRKAMAEEERVRLAVAEKDAFIERYFGG